MSTQLKTSIAVAIMVLTLIASPTYAAIQDLKELAISNITLGNEAVADAAIETLITDFSEYSEAADAVHSIAQHCRKLEKYQKANEIFQDVIDNWPANRLVIWSCMGMAMSNISLGNELGADAAVNKMLTDFPQDAKTTRAVYAVAGYCRQREKHQRADQLYQTVINNWPGSKYAVFARKNMAISKINLGNELGADAAIDKLTTDDSQQEDSPQMVHKIAHHYLKQANYTKAIQVFQRIVDTWPGTKYAVWSQRGLAIANMNLGNEIAADAAVTKLVTDYSSHADAARMVRAIAWHYRKAGNYQKARQVYQQVTNNWPTNDYAISAQKELAISEVVLGNDEAVDAAIDKLITDYSGHSDLARSVFRVGAEYYDKAVELQKNGQNDQAQENFQKAVTIWEKAITEQPNAAVAAQVYYFSADYYFNLGQYQKAIDRYQQVVTNWPAYKNAWNAQFLIGHTYKRLGGMGIISKSEADSKTEAAYQKVLDNYPDCPAAKAAGDWLTLHGSSN